MDGFLSVKEMELYILLVLNNVEKAFYVSQVMVRVKKKCKNVKGK